jgi:hypothetical protein
MPPPATDSVGGGAEWESVKEHVKGEDDTQDSLECGCACRWVTLRARWVTLRARVGDAESSLGDAKSSSG